MSHPREPWSKHTPLVGRTITKVTNMTPEEATLWEVEAIVLELDDGTRWWISSDTEGNRGGDIQPMEPE